MISRGDLRDFNIDFDRKFDEYYNQYVELIPAINMIKIQSGILLNDYYLRNSDIQVLITEIDVCLRSLIVDMFPEDYCEFIEEYNELLSNLIEQHENREQYEICANIQKFIKKIEA